MMYSHNSSRSHHGTGRPYEVEKLRLRKEDSALTTLCELHVYKVPIHLWRDSFNNILNNYVTETVSIGIIRVPYDLYLREIRQEIDEQLQQDSQIPHDYVFLKSVGRSLTRLRSKQEGRLKAKHFIPPNELFILECTPEIKDALAISERSSQSPPISRRTNRGYPHSYRNGYRGDSDTDTSRRKSPVSVQKYPALPQIESDRDQQLNNGPPNQAYDRYDPYNRPNEQYFRPSDPYNNRQNDGYNRPNENQIRSNDQNEYRLNHDPYNNERDQNTNPHRDSDPYQSRQHPHTTPNPPQQEFYEAPEPQQRDQQPETRVVAQAYHASEPARGPSRETSPSRRHPEGKEPANDNRTGVAGSSPEDDFNRRNRDDYSNMLSMEEEERRRRLEELENRNNLDKSRWDSDEEERRRRAENDRRRREEDERREREEEEERRRREENERLRREEEEKRRREEEDRRRNEEEDERRRRDEDEAKRRRDQEEEEEERRRREEQERRQREEQERREEEERLRNRPVEDEVSTPELQERDTESAKQRRREEKNRLLQELEEARRVRQNQEFEREELVRRAKSMQHKTTNRRNEARDMWKKKYFEEKKKTAPMDETRNRSEQELDNLHRRLMNTLEGPKEKNLKVTHANPSEKNNYVIQCTKLQHDIEDLQRRVENAKMKLTAEMKLRAQAQTEMKAIRAEAMQNRLTLRIGRAAQRQPATARLVKPKTQQSVAQH